MKEITRIHLAAMPYNIEIAAKKDLEKYIASIERAMGGDEDMLREVESRMCELLTDRAVVGEKVITMADVYALREQLGTASDFAGDADGTVTGTKRLMRESRGAMLGGVCSGMAVYFSLDVVLIRAIWIVLTLMTSGAMVLVYIILVMITPMAKTASDRAQMSGREVNLESIKDAYVYEVEKNQRPLLAIARLAAGVFALLGALGAFLTLFLAKSYIIDDYMLHMSKDPQFSVYNSIFIIGMIIAGLLLILFFSITSYMLFTAKFTKKLLIILGTISILGISIAAISITSANIGRYGVNQSSNNNSINCSSKFCGNPSTFTDTPMITQ